MEQKKILIIGGGIAGSSLAIQLLKKGTHVTLLDRGTNYSTNVAAGMVNPLVFRRMNLSWKIDFFYPFAIDFYESLQINTHPSLLHKIKIRRLFSSPEEKVEWNKKITLNEYAHYLNPIRQEDLYFEGAKCPFGSGTVNAFWVDSKAYYKYSQEYIQCHGQLLQEEFDQKKFLESKLMYDSVKYDGIVFCIGYENKKHALFDFIPVQTTKGQLISVFSDRLPMEESLNRKCYAIPKEPNTFLIGATYEWNNTTLHTDEKGKEELANKFSYITDEPFTVIQQEAGIRPTMLDRRPVLGQHPTLQGVHIFNGLGTKGFLMAPRLAEEMALHLLENKPIDKEIHISRFIA